jgi:hypothetical protein
MLLKRGRCLINPVLHPALMLNACPVTMTSKMERLPGLVKRSFHLSLLARETLAHPNPAAIEMALYARSEGVHTISK